MVEKLNIPKNESTWKFLILFNNLLSFNVFDICWSCVVKFESSEFSISWYVTSKTRLTRRIIFDVLSIIIEELKSAIAFSVCCVSWIIASSKEQKKIKFFGFY